MKKLILLSLALLFAPFALAQDTTTFQWDLSTSEPLGTGGGYHLYASKQSGTYAAANIVSTEAAGANTTTIDSSALRGKWCFVATAFMLDDKGTTDPADDVVVESGFSNEVCSVYKPNPPTNLKKVETP